ncbi:hypothetical protein Sjap_009669 [Stephania japonica]|uniref:Uncharacterized protein n=1 Tax=Stephania japonica TaxID=461633 RepID=A0AAP0JA98_9MAGN
MLMLINQGTVYLSFVPDEKIGGGFMTVRTSLHEAMNVVIVLDEGLPSFLCGDVPVVGWLVNCD